MNAQEESKKLQEEDYKNSVEYLRAKYLKKGGAKAFASTEAENVKQSEAAADGNPKDDLQFLKSKYSAKSKKDVFSIVRRISLLSVVLVTAFCAILWFATPVTELGGEVYKEKTLNLYSFLYGSENSVYNQIKTGFENIKNIDTESVEGIGSLMQTFRAVVLGFSGVYVLLFIIIDVISATVYFFKGKTEKLASVSVRSLVTKLSAYILFAFLGNVSGGVGKDSYYMGYSIGVGMTVGMLFGLTVLIALSVAAYIRRRKTASALEKLQFNRFVCSGLAYTAIGIVAAFLRLYSVFMYTFSSCMTAIAGAVSQGINVKALVFPLLNLLLVCSCCIIVKKVYTGLSCSYEYLLNFGEKTDNEIGKKARKQKERAQLRYIVVILVMSVLSCIAVFILNIPSFGYGWSVNLYAHFIVIFAFSSAATVCNAVIFKRGDEAATEA